MQSLQYRALPWVLSGFLHWALCSSVQLYAEPYNRIQSSILVSIWSSLLCTRRSENRLKLLSHKHTFRWTLGLLAHAAWRMQPSTYKSSETLVWWCTPGACTHGISITAEALRHSPFGLPSKQPFNAPELEACVWLPERCFSLKPSETIWALPSAHRRVQFVCSNRVCSSGPGDASSSMLKLTICWCAGHRPWISGVNRWCKLDQVICLNSIS